MRISVAYHSLFTFHTGHHHMPKHEGKWSVMLWYWKYSQCGWQPILLIVIHVSNCTLPFLSVRTPPEQCLFVGNQPKQAQVGWRHGAPSGLHTRKCASAAQNRTGWTLLSVFGLGFGHSWVSPVQTHAQHFLLHHSGGKTTPCSLG